MVFPREGIPVKSYICDIIMIGNCSLNVSLASMVTKMCIYKYEPVIYIWLAQSFTRLTQFINIVPQHKEGLSF